MNLTEKGDLTKGSVVKRLLGFFLPVALGTIVQQLYNTADALIVGRYVGTGALAAVGGSATQIINLIIGVFVAITSGASVVVAHYYGEKNEDGVARATNASIFCCTIIGIGVTAFGIIFTPSLLRLMKTPEDTIADASMYLRILFAASVCVILYNMGAGILRASGDSKRPFFYLLACCVTNVVLDYIFVAKFYWGVQGAAIATAGSQIISVGLVLIRLARADEAYRLRWKYIRWDSFNIKKMMYIGIPSGLQQAMYAISNSVIQVAVNSLGTATVAAWSLCGKIDGVYWAVVSALGTAVMSFIGQNYGAGRIDRVKECVKKSLIISLLGSVVMSTLILTIGSGLVPLFDSNPEVIELTKYTLWQFVPYYFLWPGVEVYSGALKGTGDAVVPVIILLLGTCALRIIWVYLVFGFFGTLHVLCVCYPVTWFVSSVPLCIRYKRGKWNKTV